MNDIKVGIAGDENSCVPFKALGVPSIITDEETSFEEIENEINGNGFGLVMVTEDLFEKHQTGFENLMKKETSVLIIPSAGESKNLAYLRIKKIVEKAVGADILERKE